MFHGYGQPHLYFDRLLRSSHFEPNGSEPRPIAGHLMRIKPAPKPGELRLLLKFH